MVELEHLVSVINLVAVVVELQLTDLTHQVQVLVQEMLNHLLVELEVLEHLMILQVHLLTLVVEAVVEDLHNTTQVFNQVEHLEELEELAVVELEEMQEHLVQLDVTQELQEQPTLVVAVVEVAMALQMVEQAVQVS
jgi:hypothetical protein